MQETLIGHHGNTSTTHSPTASGLLEGADGVVSLYAVGQLIATVEGEAESLDFTVDRGKKIRAINWRFDSIRWSHYASLLILQGASLQQLVEPYLLLRAQQTPLYAPVPRAKRVSLAELIEVPEGMSRQELFTAFHQALPF